MNVRVSFAITLVGFLIASASQAQELPVGYELVRATNTALTESTPSMNSRSQIVFPARLGGDNTTMEIYLYDGRTGELTQLTDNNWFDGLPDISETGAITWAADIAGGVNGAGKEIMLRTPDGTVTRLTDNQVEDSSPSINGLNQVAWWRLNARGCAEAGRDVMFFDGQTTHQITDNDWGNQAIDLSDSGDIIWTEFDFCPGGFNWRSKIKLYRDAQILTLLDDDDLQAQSTAINNVGLCAWSFSHRITFDQGIHLWEDGELTLLTDWGINPKLNDAGDMYLIRWHDNSSTWQAWLYLNGRFHQLTDDPHWNTGGEINSLGEACWRGGPPGDKDIWYLRRLPLGDLNCDGIVDAFDIEGFLQALFDPKNFPPDCDPTLADINQDGLVNAFDIEPFIELLFP